MKYLLLAGICVGLAASLASLAAIPNANAAVCAAGVYRAGCVGPRGAVVKTTPVYHPHCYWRAGVKVCR
jgi:hypothetical protein